MIGYKVTEVPAEGSVAEEAGLRKGDYLLSVDGTGIQSHQHFMDLMAEYDGQLIDIEFLRYPRILKKKLPAGRLGVILKDEHIDKLYADALEVGKFASVIVTTAPMVEGRPVSEVLDVITSECVFGLNIFKDIFASVRDVVGGRNAAFQNALRDARVECLKELRREAYELGADAIIGLDLDYSEVSGGGKSMLFLVASGTAVKLSS